MSEEKVTCPICKHGQDVKERRRNDTMASYECPVCGKYDAPVFWASTVGSIPPDRKLSAWIREQNERGELVSFAKQEMIEAIVASIPDYRPLEKQLKLLQAIERKSAYAGDAVSLGHRKDFPLAYADNPDEFKFHRMAIKERGFAVDQSLEQIVITSTGWDYLDKHASDLEQKTQGFVAMSFSEEMKSMWEEAIKPAIQEAGYTAFRVDEEPHSANIIFKIMAEIKNSRFVVADVTEQRNGVYFEAGYALGLGIPVIWSVRKDDAAKVHFDTAQYNQIRWETAKESREGLFDYICAIIGKRN